MFKWERWVWNSREYRLCGTEIEKLRPLRDSIYGWFLQLLLPYVQELLLLYSHALVCSLQTYTFVYFIYSFCVATGRMAKWQNFAWVGVGWLVDADLWEYCRDFCLRNHKGCVNTLVMWQIRIHIIIRVRIGFHNVVKERHDTFRLRLEIRHYF